MIFVARLGAFLLLLLFVPPLQAQWHRATTPHFEIFAEGNAEQVRARAERLERFDAALRLIGGIEPDQDTRPVTIFFVRDVSAIEAMLGRRYHAAAGFYSPRPGGSLIVAPARTPRRGAGAQTSDSILYHEYAHHFLLQNFAAAYPPWFVEGFAEFYATAALGPDGSVTVGAVPQFRVESLWAGQGISARDLLTTGSIDVASRTLDQFYARSWLLVHYLTFNRGRTGQRARYVRLIEQGSSLEDAARTAFGDLEALDFELQAYIRSPIANATVAPAALRVPPIEVSALTSGQVAILPLRIEHMRGVAPERVPAFLTAVRGAAARHPADPEAAFLLAEGEGLAGNHDASDRIADALLSRLPNHSRALLRKARNLEARGDQGRRAARPLIVRANRADPRDPLPLIAYYRSFDPAHGESPSKLAVDGLLLAVQLSPQSASLRLIGGAALAKAGRLGEAENVLRPAAYAPHGGPTAARAQALLALVTAARPGSGSSPELTTAAGSVLTELLD